LTVAHAERFVLRQHALQPGDDLTDYELVKRANPLSTITPDTLREKHDSPSMREEHWSRFTCGVPMESEAPWILPSEWDALEGTPDVERRRPGSLGSTSARFVRLVRRRRGVVG
jgi:hypothetical protein